MGHSVADSARFVLHALSLFLPETQYAIHRGSYPCDITGAFTPAILLFCPSRIVVLRRIRNAHTAVQFCRGAPTRQATNMTVIMVEPDSGDLWMNALRGDTSANAVPNRLITGEIGCIDGNVRITSSINGITNQLHKIALHSLGVTSAPVLAVGNIGINRPKNQPSYRKILRSKY